MGDVLPFCALGRAVAARGHRVAVAANPHFAAEVARTGLHFIPIGDEEDYLRLTAAPDWVDGVRGFTAIMRYVARGLAASYDVIAAHRPQRIVAHPLALAAPVADEKLGCEAITTYLSPAILQSAHLPPVQLGVPNGERFPRWYKRTVMWATDRVILDGAIAPAVNSLRASLGMAS